MQDVHSSKSASNPMLAQQETLKKQMEDEYSSFASTLDVEHYDNALKI